MMKMPLKDSPLLTSASGASGRFDTTHWSVVLLAGESRSPQSAEALEKLCRTYWQPLYVFIRRQGHGLEDAQDLTQEFFARLFERNDLSAVDPRKGKFRTFLLAALTHFLANERERANAQKCAGVVAFAPLDANDAEEWLQTELATSETAEHIFDRGLASEATAERRFSTNAGRLLYWNRRCGNCGRRWPRAARAFSLSNSRFI